MFTGIVEELGKITALQNMGRVLRIGVEVGSVVLDAKVGDSICVDGVCLTIVGAKGRVLFFEAIPETLSLSTLKYLKYGQEVNLERALKLGDRLGGHFVSGHVDCMGTIRSRKITKGNLEFCVSVAPKFLRFVVSKGSVTLDGISLTVADKKGGGFCVCIIPHTAAATTLRKKHAGDRVNVEFDMLIKQTLSLKSR
jgi:riboflavin synthase